MDREENELSCHAEAEEGLYEMLCKQNFSISHEYKRRVS